MNGFRDEKVWDFIFKSLLLDLSVFNNNFRYYDASVD